jgi:predicted secreted protein
MTIALSLGLFFVIWWTLLFAVLPFGVRTQAEAGDIVPGTPASAPVLPRLKRVVLINTVLSMVVFAIAYVAIQSNVLDLDPTPPAAVVPQNRR